MISAVWTHPIGLNKQCHLIWYPEYSLVSCSSLKGFLPAFVPFGINCISALSPLTFAHLHIRHFHSLQVSPPSVSLKSAQVSNLYVQRKVMVCFNLWVLFSLHRIGFLGCLGPQHSQITNSSCLLSRCIWRVTRQCIMLSSFFSASSSSLPKDFSQLANLYLDLIFVHTFWLCSHFPRQCSVCSPSYVWNWHTVITR